MNNILEVLQKNVNKIQDAISDIDYASSYSNSSASSSYCSYANSSLGKVVDELMSAATNQDNLVNILQNSISKINSAISDIDYASSYSRSSAVSSYCSYATRTLRGVKEELKSLSSNLDKNKSQSNEEDLERAQ